jgi:hypothetical protein
MAASTGVVGLHVLKMFSLQFSPVKFPLFSLLFLLPPKTAKSAFHLGFSLSNSTWNSSWGGRGRGFKSRQPDFFGLQAKKIRE